MVGKGNPLEILETFFKKMDYGQKISKSDIKPETGNF